LNVGDFSERIRNCERIAYIGGTCGSGPLHMNRAALLVAILVAIAGCAVAPALDLAPSTAARHIDSASVERRPLADSPTPAALPAVLGDPFARASLPAIVVPPNMLYLCVVDVAGVRKQTAIEFAPKVGELCAKHPEMGPCQYERNACRRNGGHIYAANGVEITMATEAKYDEKVLRVRFKGG
jgi:hypothetical protein